MFARHLVGGEGAACYSSGPALWVGSPSGSARRRLSSRVAGRPPRSCGCRARPGEQVRLAIKGLAAKTRKRGSAPNAGELSQGRGGCAIAVGGEKVGRLPAVEPTFKISGHIGLNPSLREIRGNCGSFPDKIPRPDKISWWLTQR